MLVDLFFFLVTRVDWSIIFLGAHGSTKGNPTDRANEQSDCLSNVSFSCAGANTSTTWMQYMETSIDRQADTKHELIQSMGRQCEFIDTSGLSRPCIETF